jgi:hypothetical protein
MVGECSRHLRQHKFANVSELRNHIAWLNHQVSRRGLNLIECSIPLNEALKEGRVIDDIEAWVFDCPNCNARFQLSVDNYHGGALWRQLAPAEDSYFDFLRKVSEAERRRNMKITDH